MVDGGGGGGRGRRTAEQLRRRQRSRQEAWRERRRRQAQATALLLRRLRALADARRLQMVETLQDGARNVGELEEWLGLRQSLLSYHLKVLTEAGLVCRQRVGQNVSYAIEPGAFAEMTSRLRALGRIDAYPVARPRLSEGGPIQEE